MMLEQMRTVCGQSIGLKWLEKSASIAGAGEHGKAHLSRYVSNSTIRLQSLGALGRFRRRGLLSGPSAVVASPVMPVASHAVKEAALGDLHQ
jgi:hypothetical protein